MKLETSKKLQETADKFGVELPESEEYNFLEYRYTDKKLNRIMILAKDEIENHDVPLEEISPAYTTDELLELLPKYIITQDRRAGLDMTRCTFGGITCRYQYSEFYGQGTSLNEALAKLAIELIKNKIKK